jgi:hypothetical protein
MARWHQPWVSTVVRVQLHGVDDDGPDVTTTVAGVAAMRHATLSGPIYTIPTSSPSVFLSPPSELTAVVELSFTTNESGTIAPRGLELGLGSELVCVQS